MVGRGKTYQPTVGKNASVQKKRKAGTKGVAQTKPQSNPNGLPADLQSGLETLSGYDMSDVTVNYNSARPSSFGAHAVAQGHNIDLGPGQEKHLPHEAWHVVQQKQGRVHADGNMAGTPVNTDPSLESEADMMGARALQVLSSKQGESALVQPSHTVVEKPIQGAWYDPLAVSEKIFRSFNNETYDKDDEVEAFSEEVKTSGLSAIKTGKNATAKKEAETKFGLISHGLEEWTKSTTSAAKAYYTEFDEAKDASGGAWNKVYFGISDFTDPDFMIEDDYGKKEAHEVKYITADTQGSVDTHLRKANTQLRSRTAATLIADIHIDSAKNPWPYTPTDIKSLDKSKVNNKALEQRATDRNIGTSKKKGPEHLIRIVWDCDSGVLPIKAGDVLEFTI